MLTTLSAAPQEDGRAALLAALALAVAMILGGGGSPAPMAELAVQLIIAALFCLWLVWLPLPSTAKLKPALPLCGLLLAIPAIQLVPLPPTFWQALPGRQLELAALDLVGAADSWRPFSLTPARTLASLLALIPPAIVIVLTGTLGPAGRSMVIGMIAAISLLAVLVGVLQTVGGETNPLRFYVPDAGYLNGFQANHNSAADVLLIGIVAYATTVGEWVERRRISADRRMGAAILLTGMALLSVAVFLTASRAGTALLPVAWLASYLATRSLWRIAPRRLLLGCLAAAAATGLGLFLLRANAVLAGVLARYDFGSEFRLQIWVDSFYAAQTYFPVGAGMGSFIPVFMTAERLEAVHASLPNRAHNDYLELVIEAGIPGLLVLAIFALIVIRWARAQLRDPSQRVRRQTIFALAVFTIVALHSQVDYPLRSMSLACIAAASAGLLVPVARRPRGADVPTES